MRFIYLLFLAMFFSPCFAVAKSAWLADKEAYFAAQKALKAGEPLDAFAALSTHPLYPYLLTTYYEKNPTDNVALSALFSRYYSVPVVKQLHNQLILKRYQEGDDRSVVELYFDSGNLNAACAYRHAALRLGNQKAAFDQLESLWLSDKPLPFACHAVFAASPLIKNNQAISKRATLLLAAKQVKAAKQLLESVANPDQRQTALLRVCRFYEDPESMLNVSADSLSKMSYFRDFLPMLLDRLIKRDAKRYSVFIRQFALAYRQNADYQKTLAKLVVALSNQDSSDEARYAFLLLNQEDNDATDAFLRMLLRQQDFKTISEVFDLNTENSQALFWLGESLQRLKKDSSKAEKAFKKAAKTRSYYGFLAADKLGQAYAFNYAPILPDKKIQKAFDENPAFLRAKILKVYGENAQARNEIFSLAGRMLNERKRQLAYWLHREQFYFEAIYLLGQIRDWNDINIRFPRPYNTSVFSAAEQQHLAKSMVYAIMRQETSMNERASSSAKAKGLMQLIPSTAKHVAKLQNISLTGNDIFNPRINILLGSTYLAELYQRFNNFALVAAGYNAGPSRAERWLAKTPDPFLWVENIPFDETRRYVKRILEYQQVYAELLREKVPRVTALLLARPAHKVLENQTNAEEEKAEEAKLNQQNETEKEMEER